MPIEGDAAYFEYFSLDDVDVSLRIDGAFDVNDVLVVEAADDLDDRVGLPNVREELVAQAFAFAGALDETRNVHNLDVRVDRRLAS